MIQVYCFFIPLCFYLRGAYPAQVFSGFNLKLDQLCRDRLFATFRHDLTARPKPRTTQAAGPDNALSRAAKCEPAVPTHPLRHGMSHPRAGFDRRVTAGTGGFRDIRRHATASGLRHQRDKIDSGQRTCNTLPAERSPARWFQQGFIHCCSVRARIYYNTRALQKLILGINPTDRISVSHVYSCSVLGIRASVHVNFSYLTSGQPRPAKWISVTVWLRYSGMS